MNAKIAKSFKYIRSGIIIELIMMVLDFMVHVINSKTKPDHNWNNFVIECLIVGGFILVFFVTYNIVKNTYRNRKMIFWQEKEDHLDQAKGLLSACRLTFVYFVVVLFAVIIFVSNLDSRINMTRLVNPLREPCKSQPASPKAHQP